MEVDATLTEAAGNADLAVGQRLGGRFTLTEVLGAGAHGVVYAAEDDSGGRPVAIKTLARLDPDELYRFKREFRVLADVSHDNLVTLYELFVEPSGAYFSMELVRGRDFLSHVRGDEFTELHEGRLHEALRQLATGLHALHGFGKLHRDLKPSNVLVREGDDRVLVADFGLAEELAATHEWDLVGTPAYMSPEQAAGQELTPASDWYAVGVMLYEALTGEYPFAGAFGKAMLIAKQGPPPPPPSSLVPDLDELLEDLCMQLLRRDPEDRPRGEEVLAILGRTDAPQWTLPTASDTVGRTDELSVLRDAFSYTRAGMEGRAAVVMLHGPSGVGKTTIVESFVESLPETTLVLRGRCYERESVPYKGFDTVIDDLRRHLHLQARRGDPVASVVGGAALARLFPVLRDVHGIGDTPGTIPEDALELRRRAVAALGELLDALTRRHALVLVIDDLQWSDADTSALLLALLRPTFRPGMLVVATYRDDDASAAEHLASVRAELTTIGSGLRLDDVGVGPLADDDARTLARQLLTERDDEDALTDAIVAEADGSPLFIAELVRFAGPAGLQLRGALSLDAVIGERVARLPAPARALLELSAVAGGPVERQIIADAAGDDAATDSVALLRAQGLVRTHGPRPTDAIEPFHDRIRTAVVAALADDARRDCHGRLATQLQRRAADPEMVATHLHAAGRSAEAARYVTRAADRAAEALALKRAARLYGQALELSTNDPAARQRLRIARAEVLAADGRSAEAAAAYLDACDHADRTQIVRLRSHAAEQLLRSGRIDEGTVQLRKVLEPVGLRPPPDPRVALASLVWQRARVWRRGLAFDERPAESIADDVLLKVDTSRAAATGLLQTNVLTGQYFQAVHLLLALDAGEPHRVARALGLEALYAATGGTTTAREVDDLVARVLGLSRRLDDPHGLGLGLLAAGTADLYRGRFVDALPKLREAEEILRQRCTHVAWELMMARTMLSNDLYHLGDFEALQHTVELALEDAAERDDLHTALMIKVAFGPMPALAAGDVARARQVLAECEESFPSQLRTSTYNYVRLLTRARLSRYDHQPAAAWEAFERHRGEITRSLMLTKQPLKTFWVHERACTAAWLANEARDTARDEALAQAAAGAKTLAKLPTRWARAMGKSIDASLAAARGDIDEARTHALDAEHGMLELGMAVHAAAMRLRRGELSRGSEGATLVEDALTTMGRRGIAAPTKIADMLLPPVLGWW